MSRSLSPASSKGEIMDKLDRIAALLEEASRLLAEVRSERTLTTSYGRGAHLPEGRPELVVVDPDAYFPDDIEAYGDYEPEGA